MTHRPLGSTGLTVSALSLGTVSLGMDYGIGVPDRGRRLGEEDAVALVRLAVDRGIRLIDTAPAYGAAERIVGRAVGDDSRAIVATKIAAGVAVAESVDASRRALNRDAIDILQIHSATRAQIEDGATVRALAAARESGAVRVLGATVYDEEAARAAIGTGEFGMIQVALSVLDQRMLRTVIPAAAAAGIGVVVRSAFLKGALTPKAPWLPASLTPLVAAAAQARDTLASGKWEALPQAAMRFCLSVAGVSSVLAGVATVAELDAAIAAAAAGPLDGEAMRRAKQLGIDDEALLNPSRWPPSVS